MTGTLRAEPVKIQWHPGLPVYAAGEFLRSVADEYGWIGGLDATNNLRCILPYTIIRKARLRMARFRVETVQLGDAMSIDQEKSFLNSVVRYFRTLKADVIIPASTNTIFRTFPDHAIAAPYGTYVIDLSETEETLWRNMHSKHRNVVRNAQKKGVRVLDGLEYKGEAYRLIEQTFKRSRLPFMSYDAFGRLISGLGSRVKMFIADHEGAVQGCAVIPFSQQTAYYAYGGTVSNPLTGATNLLQWEAIKHFRGLGVKRYDFCGARINPEKGSKAAGLVMYKERFGSKLIRGYLWKQSLTRKSLFYSLGVRLLRGGDIVDRERHKLVS